MAIIRYGTNHTYGAGYRYRQDLPETSFTGGSGRGGRPVSRRQQNTLMRHLFHERREEEIEDVMFILGLLDILDEV